MHTCELFSIRKSKLDFDVLSTDFDFITTVLAEQGIIVRYKTDVSADPKRISEAVAASLEGDPSELYLFVNALSTSDSSSFKNLFYEFIADQEAELTVDEEHAGMIPKLKVFSIGDLGYGYKGYCFRNKGKVFVAVPYASLTGMNIPDLLCLATNRAVDILTNNRDEYPDGVVYVPDPRPKKKAPVKKESFLMSFIPHKGDNRGDVIRKIIVLIALIAFIISSGYLLGVVTAGIESDASNTKIQQIAHPNGNENTDETTADGDALPAEDWAALKKINKEIVGWVRIKDTPVNYPVLLHKGDDASYQYYLNHSYEKEYSDYGSIFVDYRSLEGVNSKNVILHGHNMLNGSMFHELANYADGYSFNPKLDYYKKHAVVTFNTPDGDAQWKIISVFKTSTYYAHGEFFNYMQGSFNSDAEFMNFVYNVRIRSMFNTPVMVNEDDQILTLSTCSYEFGGFRTVVVARKVRPGEDPNVDVQLASINSSPLYPDVYYSSYGGYRPDPLTFKTAYANGSISWYDGKGNLEGSETLTGTISANPIPGDDNTAQTPSYTYFTVTYRNYDNSQIAAYTVKKGDPVPVPEVIPTYEDEYYTYKFIEWNRKVSGVNFNALNTSVTIYPRYEYIPKEIPTEEEPTEPEEVENVEEPTEAEE